MYIPLPERRGPSTGEAISRMGSKIITMMTAIFARTAQQYSDMNIDKRATVFVAASEARSASSDSQRNRTGKIVLFSFLGVVLVIIVMCTCTIADRDTKKQRSLSSQQSSPLSRTSTRTPRPYAYVPGRPTGEMGAARAALSPEAPPTTAPPSRPLPQTSETRTPRPYAYRRGRPTGEMGAAREALGATIEPEPIETRSEDIVPRLSRNQESDLQLQNGTRVISRPIQEQDSIYTLRPGESTVEMMQRVDNEFHESVANYPIFQNSLPGRQSPPRSPLRPLRPGERFDVDHGVRRQFASYPIFQHSSGARQPNRERSNDELRQNFASLPMFGMPVEYRPTRRPAGSVTPGFMTPPPEYEHTPSYYQVHEELSTHDDDVPRSQANTGHNEETAGSIPTVPPPVYTRYQSA